MKSMLIALAAAGSLVAAGGAWAQAATDAQAEEAGCVKCHKPDTKKVGPSQQELSQKLKGKDATAILPDFKDIKQHKKLTLTDDQLKPLITWMLSH